MIDIKAVVFDTKIGFNCKIVPPFFLHDLPSLVTRLSMGRNILIILTFLIIVPIYVTQIRFKQYHKLNK